jgi:hypothetical protein
MTLLLVFVFLLLVFSRGEKKNDRSFISCLLIRLFVQTVKYHQDVLRCFHDVLNTLQNQV